MTTGADQVLPQRAGGLGRLAARASVGSGVTGALANTLLLAFVVLAYVRPSALQATLWPLACLSAGASALLLVPVALVLGGSSAGALGVASMAFSAVTWLLLATGVLTRPRGHPCWWAARSGSRCGWCWRANATPCHPAFRVGRRAGVAAFAGTLVVAVGYTLLPAMSTAWLVVLTVGGVPAVLGWFCVPAWSLRLGGGCARPTTPLEGGLPHVLWRVGRCFCGGLVAHHMAGLFRPSCGGLVAVGRVAAHAGGRIRTAAERRQGRA